MRTLRSLRTKAVPIPNKGLGHHGGPNNVQHFPQTVDHLLLIHLTEHVLHLSSVLPLTSCVSLSHTIYIYTPFLFIPHFCYLLECIIRLVVWIRMLCVALSRATSRLDFVSMATNHFTSRHPLAWQHDDAS